MAKLNSQEVELNMKNQAAETFIAKIGQQTERVSQKRKDSDLEEQNVSIPLCLLCLNPVASLSGDGTYPIVVAVFVQVAAIKAEVTQRQKDCEDDLIKAEPALEAATAALDTLNKVINTWGGRKEKLSTSRVLCLSIVNIVL